MMAAGVFCVLLVLLPSLGHSSPLLRRRNETLSPQRAVDIKGCGVSNYEYNSPDRIIGGRFAEVGEYPWQVSLREYESGGYGHVCGGSILNDRWIVTAAHCFVYHSASMYEVAVGLHKLSKLNDKTVQVIKIEKFILHEKYQASTNDNDIALIKLKTRINFAISGGNINGVCLPKSGSDPTGYGTVSGWGHTVEDGEMSDTLKTVEVPVIPRSICNDAYDHNPFDGIDDINNNMVCAGSKGRDACQYDSGGPLVQWKNDIATLIGVVSFGSGCGMPGYPGVYTRVSVYIDWIERKAV